ncbi:MAG TPA: rhodanese-like domain-containing protein [Allosphingosinicella sp.]|nr:rhodanese-like domain-containing protein [Allosphingosinicella sp.]
MSLNEVKQRLDRGEALLFDCNLASDYARRHLPGARHIGLAPPDRSRLPADRDAELIFYCSAPLCLSCHLAAREALRLGYRRVRVMPDGIRGWAAAGYPLRTAESCGTPRRVVS